LLRGQAAIEVLETTARNKGTVEALGDLVHNKQVLERLAKQGITVVKNISDIRGDIVAIGTHGVIPQVEDQIMARFKEIINTTCPFVHRAQIAARRLARAGFHIIIFGDASHPEVKGILGWADNQGIATLDSEYLGKVRPLPRRIGILSQTTQVPADFTAFAEKL